MLTVDSRPHPAVILAYHDGLGHFGSCEVGKTEPYKLASFMEIISRLKRLCKRCGPVCSVDIADLGSV